jgi:hypothetical protein
MSYVLFSQTSTANGTRNTWNTSSGQTTTATNTAVVKGTLVSDVANSLFNEGAIVAAGGWNSGDT